MWKKYRYFLLKYKISSLSNTTYVFLLVFSGKNKNMENLGSVKLIVLGDSSVGKSTMIVKFTEETFNANIGSTVGIEMYQKMVKIAN